MNRIHGKRCARADDLRAALANATVLIHATQTGMSGKPGIPVPESLLRPDLWVSEVVYVPLETALLAGARRAGCRVMDGGHMTVGHAIDAFRLFAGRDADPLRMEAQFRRLVA